MARLNRVRRRLAPGFVAVLALAAAVAPAQAAGRACAADFAHKADTLLAPYAEVGALSGAVLVARDGRVALRRAVGLADREWNVPNTPDTEFRLGSVTKQFTAAAILQLAEQGKLSIDDPVSRFYADAPAAWSKVTIRTLLNHTSGIPSYTAIPGFFDGPARLKRSPEEIIRLTRDEPLEFEPGSKFAYDNSGYIILGYVIEKASGQRYADYLKAHIFGPLGMTNTGYDVTEQILPRRASGYAYGPEGWTNAIYIDMSVPYAAGSLYSTVDDLLVWEEALFGGRVVSPASLKLMTTDWGHGYGFGLGVGKAHGHPEIAHDGGIPGFTSSLRRYPGDGVTSIVLSNFIGASASKIATDLALSCLGESPYPPEVKLSRTALDRFTGRYAAGPGPAFRISREAGHLLAVRPGELPTRLYPEGQRAFFSRIHDGEVDFELDATGKPSALVIHIPRSPDIRLAKAPGP